MMNPPSQPWLLPAPDTGFHLTAEQRARLHPQIPADVFERLLQWVKPGSRGDFLGTPFFPGAEKLSLGEIRSESAHPEVQQLVDELNAAIRVGEATS
jgi:hypothetical protein